MRRTECRRSVTRESGCSRALREESTRNDTQLERRLHARGRVPRLCPKTFVRIVACDSDEIINARSHHADDGSRHASQADAQRRKSGALGGGTQQTSDIDSDAETQLVGAHPVPGDLAVARQAGDDVQRGEAYSRDQASIIVTTICTRTPAAPTAMATSARLNAGQKRSCT